MIRRPGSTPDDRAAEMTDPPTVPLFWAQRLKRIFDIDIPLSPHCGGQLRVITDVNEPTRIRKILIHLQQRAPPRMPPRHAEPHRILHDPLAPH